MISIFRKRFAKRAIIMLCLAISFTGLAIFLSNYLIIKRSNAAIYDQISEIPANDVGLVLGTSKYARSGGPNLYYRNRINAAAELYHQGKIRHIIVSGDNRFSNYDEPTEMLHSLVELGVPKEHITCDYAGFRTLDSMVRCKKVFNQNRVTVISQRFHLQRAIYIGKFYGMDAIGYAAKDVGINYSRTTALREYLAKSKAMLDLYILRKKPHFLGEPVKINL